MKKRILSMICLVALCLTMLPGTALAGEANIWNENRYGLFIPSTRYGALATNDTNNYFLSKDTSIINLTSPYVPFEKAKAQLFKDITVIFVKSWEAAVKEANLNDKNRYWTTTADGVVDFESGQETSFEGYNLGFDKESATLYLNGAYLKGSNPLTLNAGADYMLGKDTLTIELTGENRLIPYEIGSTSAILFGDDSSTTSDITPCTGNLTLTGSGSLEVQNGLKSSYIVYDICVPDGNLTITGGAQVTARTVPTKASITAIRAEAVTIEDGGVLAIDLAVGTNSEAFKADSVTVERGGALHLSVGSGIMTDLSMLDEDSDLSNSTFTVDGVLTLPEDMTTERLPKIFRGSGIVMLDGRAYAIAADGSLTTPDGESAVNGDIEVTLGTPVTNQKGYTWTGDEDGNWTLTLLTSMVVGNISIKQDTGEEDFNPDDWHKPEVDEAYANPDIIIRLVTEKPCTVYGDITCAPTEPYTTADYRYQYLVGTLAISGAGLTADTVEYQYGAVQLSGTLDARSLSAWQARLLEDADLTLSEGISLTLNDNGKPTQILPNVSEDLSQYDPAEVKEQVMQRYNDAFIMADGARYSYTGAEGTPIQVNLNCNPLVVISTEEGDQDEGTLRLTLSQEELERTIQIPYDLKSDASLVLDISTSSSDVNTVYVVALRSEGALELPVPVASDGGGGGSGGSGGASGNKTETVTNPDGSTTTTVTSPDGTVTETTKYPDGSQQVVETKKDGTVTTTVTKADGSGSVTVVDENGNVVSEATLSAAAINAAQAAGTPVVLPMPEIPVTTDRESAPTVTVSLPTSSAVKVEIPVTDVTPGTVAVLVKDDGTEEVIKTSLVTDTGVAVTLSDGDTVKIVDNSKDFADVPDSYWGADAVAFATSREIFSGTSDTTFEPEEAMTRAMIITVLARLESVDTSVGDTWYEAGVQWAVQSGISDGSSLEQSLTREQLATMLYRYAGEPAVSVSLSGYTDAANVSDWAQTAMAWAVENGIITGTTDTSLSPQDPATRAQVATILMRYVQGSV